MHVIAAAASTESYGAWAYLAVFALMVLSFAGVPAVGAAVVGWGAILASQGKLNIFWVLIVAALGAEVGGRQPGCPPHRAGDRGGVRHARGAVLPPPQGAQVAGGVSSPEVSGESR